MSRALISYGLLQLFIGVIILFVGRQLFWLFVGLAAFVVTFDIFLQLSHGLTPMWALLLSIAAGIFAAIVALTVRHILAALAAFITGVLIISHLSIGLPVAWLLPISLVFAFLLAVATAIWLEWGVIVAASLLGALTVSNGLSLWLSGDYHLLVFSISFISGLLLQGGWYYSQEKKDF